MQITVKGRYFFEKIRGTPEEAELFKGARVISVNSVRLPEKPPFSKQYWMADNVLILRFDDVDDPEGEFQQDGRYMTEEDAAAIVRFAEVADPRPVIVHCTAGISRSAAIGACLNEYFNKKLTLNESDHDRFWISHPHIRPNLHVMKLLWQRLGLRV